MLRVELTPAFILHQRAYRENSLILDVFSEQYGRVSVIAKGVRHHKRHQSALLQPYYPLLLSWLERHGSLYTLTGCEPLAPPCLLQSQASLCGLYVNELLVKLLPQHVADKTLFQAYQRVLQQLQQGQHVEIALRLFEKHLLSALGYGLVLDRDVETQQRISEQAHYQYYPDRGLCRSHQGRTDSTISGRSLRHFINERDFDEESLREIKQLMRQVLHFYLGGKPLQSRALFTQY